VPATRWLFGGVLLLGGSSVPGAVWGRPDREGQHLEHLVRWCPAHQDAYIAVFKGSFGSERNFDRLFAVGGHVAAVVAFLGQVGLSGNRSPARPTPGGFAYWYIWGAKCYSNHRGSGYRVLRLSMGAFEEGA
jgi:hypothetical protein